VGDVQAELDEVVNAIPRAAPSAKIRLELKRNQLREELRTLTSEPKAILDDDTYASMRGMEDDTGLVDLRKFNEDDQVRMLGKAVDDLIDDINTQQSSTIGGLANLAAGALNGGRALALNNSQFSVIRGLGALGNPEAVNVRTRGDNMYVADQLVVDALSDDMRRAWEGMSRPTRKIRKLMKKFEGDPDQQNRTMLAFAQAYENSDRAVAEAEFRRLGMNNRDIVQLNGAYDHMFGKDGFLSRLADMMVDTGKMSRRAADKFKKNPKMPRALRKDMMTEENMNEVREGFAKSVRTNLLRETAGVRADVADFYGLFMNKANHGMARNAEFNAMSEDLRGFYLTVAQNMPAASKGAGFETLSGAERAFRGSEYFRAWMTTPSAERAELGVDSAIFNSMYKKAVRDNEALAHSGIRNDSGEVVSSQTSYLMNTVYNKRVKMGEGFDTEDAQLAMAHLDMVQMKQGGRIGDYSFIGDPDYVMTQSPNLLKYVDYGVDRAQARLLGSNAPRVYGAAAQQHALGIKGTSTFDVIDNLRFRAEQGMHIQNVDPAQIPRFLQELDTVEDQLRSLWSMRPRGTENPSDADRAFMAASRVGVSMVSAGNFALSALAETFASTARSMGRMLTGDLGAPLDYMRGLSGAQREHLLTQINGWETTKIEMGMQSRMGDMGYEALEDVLGRETGATKLEKFENFSRGTQRVAMTGFKTLTEYSRAVVASQAIRGVHRTAQKGGYGKLAMMLDGVELDDLKQVRGLARKAGVDSGTVVSLYQNGMLNKSMLMRLQSTLTDSSMFDVKMGLKTDAFWANNPGDVGLKSAITHLLQFEVNKVNLDPRFGNKLVPKSVVQSLVATLGQFPALFYSRMRQGAWQGGAALGAGAFLLPMLLGEIYYMTLSEVARGEEPEDVLGRWSADPAGAFARVLVRANMLGGMTPMLEYATAQSVIAARKGLENPEFMKGFGSAAYFNSPINAAGLGMLMTTLNKGVGGVSDVLQGNLERGAPRLAAAAPLPYKQLWKILLRKSLNETPEGQALQAPTSQQSPRRVNRGLTMAPAAPQEEKRATGRPEAETPQKGFTSLSEYTDDSGVSFDDLDRALEDNNID